MPAFTEVQTRNPYLVGNYAPVMEEFDFTCDDGLEIEGEIPADLTGAYLRVGPNPVYLPDPEKYHWFDGDGMIHGLYFDKGRVRYSNRFVQTMGLQKESAAKKPLWGGVNIPPDFSNPDGPFKNAANTALITHAGELMALWEGGPPHVMDTDSLTTKGVLDYDGALQHAFTAHPKIDGRNREMMTFGHAPMGDRPISVSIISKDGRLVKTTSIKMKKPIFMHDAAITENYNVFLDLPMTFDIQRLQAGEKFLDWEPENGARIGVMPRHGDGDDIRWFDINTCFVFHLLSAWEEHNRISLFACRMEKPILLGSKTKETEGSAQHAKHTFVVWTIDLTSGKVEETELYAIGGDFPRMNEAYMGHKHRYGYKTYKTEDEIDFGGVAKMDLETGGIETYDFGAGYRASEFMFAPRPGKAAIDEDDGWIVSFVHEDATLQSYGVVMDAKNISVGPVAKIKIPTRVPYGFHATGPRPDRRFKRRDASSY